jgi:hypothetical protein
MLSAFKVKTNSNKGLTRQSQRFDKDESFIVASEFRLIQIFAPGTSRQDRRWSLIRNSTSLITYIRRLYLAFLSFIHQMPPRHLSTRPGSPRSPKQVETAENTPSPSNSHRTLTHTSPSPSTSHPLPVGLPPNKVTPPSTPNPFFI